MRVLHIEDNASDVFLAAELLEEAGVEEFDIEVVSHLQAARDCLIAAGSAPPDVILLDLGLPDSQGLDSLKGIMGVAGNIPIVVLTGMSDETQGREAVGLGAEDYLSKDELAAPGYLARTLVYAVDRRKRQVGAISLDSTGPKTSSLGSGSFAFELSFDGDSAEHASAPLRERNAELFEQLLSTYQNQLHELDAVVLAEARGDLSVAGKASHVIKQLVSAEAGPSDLVDLHTLAVRSYVADSDISPRDDFAESAHSLLLTLMGRLATAYREKR